MQGHILVNVGFGNYVLAERVIAIVNPVASPMRRLREDAKAEGRLVDASHGRKTRSIVITDSNHVILSAISADTLGQRFTPQQHAGSDASDETEMENEHDA